LTWPPASPPPPPDHAADKGNVDVPPPPQAQAQTQPEVPSWYTSEHHLQERRKMITNMCVAITRERVPPSVVRITTTTD